MLNLTNIWNYTKSLQGKYVLLVGIISMALTLIIYQAHSIASLREDSVQYNPSTLDNIETANDRKLNQRAVDSDKSDLNKVDKSVSTTKAAHNIPTTIIDQEESVNLSSSNLKQKDVNKKSSIIPVPTTTEILATPTKQIINLTGSYSIEKVVATTECTDPSESHVSICTFHGGNSILTVTSNKSLVDCLFTGYKYGSNTWTYQEPMKIEGKSCSIDLGKIPNEELWGGIENVKLISQDGQEISLN